MTSTNRYCCKLLFILVCLFAVNIIKAQVRKDAIVDVSVLRSFDLMDTNQKITRIDGFDKPLSLFIFLSPECPLSQNYTTTINQLSGKFSRQVNVFGIVPGNAYTTKEVGAFENKYHT